MSLDLEVRVIVVDDSADIVASQVELLTINGYAARGALSGDEALALIETFQPHCVMLDIRMPGLDGFELTKQLRARYGDDIVLIAVTGGSSNEEKVSQTLELVDHYWIKPVSMTLLEKVLPPLGRGGGSAPVAS